MAEGDFTLVTGPGWTELADAPRLVREVWGFEGVQDLIMRQSWAEIENLIDLAGQLPAGRTIIEARMIDPGSDLRFFFRCMDIPL